MSKSIEARVGAAGMKARNRGLSTEMTAGARWLTKMSRTTAGSFPSGRMSPSRAASSAPFSPEKSEVAGSNDNRAWQ